LALDRQSIEKKDFPIGRRGYDPDAVDAHLGALADEIDELKKSSRRRSETLASSASEQVRAIVEAAESSAAEIQREAEEEASEIKAEANSEAQATRQQASSQAREYVSKVSESTSVMLQRLDAMESELGALVESLRTGSNRLNADLQLLEGNLVEVHEAVSPRPAFEPEPETEPAAPAPRTAAPATRPSATLPPPAAASAAPEPVATEAYEDEFYEDVYTTQEEPVASAEGEDDTEGARLIALNMALNGTPREETDKYLSDNFTLNDRAALLDEVYSSVEG
jgi:DivIVA domain-containing protein